MTNRYPKILIKPAIIGKTLGGQMATTSRGLRYPLAADTPAVHTDLKNLADDSTSEFDDFQYMEVMKAN